MGGSKLSVQERHIDSRALCLSVKFEQSNKTMRQNLEGLTAPHARGEPPLPNVLRTVLLHTVLSLSGGFYALPASKAIFRARTYNCITYSVL